MLGQLIVTLVCTSPFIALIYIVNKNREELDRGELALLNFLWVSTILITAFTIWS